MKSLARSAHVPGPHTPMFGASPPAAFVADTTIWLMSFRVGATVPAEAMTFAFHQVFGAALEMFP